MKKYWAGIPILFAIIAGLFAFDARYLHKTEAVTMQKDIETASSMTFQSIQRDIDRRYLQDQRDKLRIVNSLLNKNPNDTYLQMRRQEIIRQIQRLEARLNGR
jgi:hypothetical protein